VQEVRNGLEHCISESTALWQHPLRLVLDYDAVRNEAYVLATYLDWLPSTCTQALTPYEG
jgi:hypothetical protein